MKILTIAALAAVTAFVADPAFAQRYWSSPGVGSGQFRQLHQQWNREWQPSFIPHIYAPPMIMVPPPVVWWCVHYDSFGNEIGRDPGMCPGDIEE